MTPRDPRTPEQLADTVREGLLTRDEAFTSSREACASAALNALLARLTECEQELAERNKSIATIVKENGVVITRVRNRAEAAEAALAQAREALRDVLPWIMVPSDTYPQHVEELGRVREAALAALPGKDDA